MYVCVCVCVCVHVRMFVPELRRHAHAHTRVCVCTCSHRYSHVLSLMCITDQGCWHGNIKTRSSATCTDFPALELAFFSFPVAIFFPDVCINHLPATFSAKFGKSVNIVRFFFEVVCYMLFDAAQHSMTTCNVEHWGEPC